MMKRKAFFNTYATDYEKFRPLYSQEFVQKIAVAAQLSSSANILEVGCGTGQATRAFHAQGFSITALDIGEELIKLARNKAPDVNYILTPFEDFTAVPKSFDMIYSAMAFHWIRPEVGFKHAASLLKDHHYLVLMDIHREFAPEIQQKMDAVYNEFEADFKAIEQIHEMPAEQRDLILKLFFDEKGKVEEAATQTYDSDSFLGLMKTMSDHHALPIDVQESFYQKLAAIFKEEGPVLECQNVQRAYLLQKK